MKQPSLIDMKCLKLHFVCSTKFQNETDHEQVTHKYTIASLQYPGITFKGLF